VSVAILGCLLYAAVRRRHAGVALAAGVLFFIAPSIAHADEPPPLPAPAEPPPLTPPAPPPAIAPPPAPAPREGGKVESARDPRVATIRGSIASSLTLARPDVPSGWAAELDALYRLRIGRRSRVDLGLEGRVYENAEANHTSVGVAAELVLELARHFELLFTVVPHHTWFDFKSDFFTNTNAYGLRYAFGGAVPVGPLVLGGTPLAFTTTSSTTVGVITQWEPRVSAGVSF
jgi:hypothetical protein